jgi:hypothetical protein
MTTISNINIISNTQWASAFPQHNSLTSVEQIYDRYAPSIYGIIDSLTQNVTISDKIFTNIFFEIKKHLLDFKIDGKVCPRLLRFTYNYTIQQLIQYGISPKVDFVNHPKRLMHLLCTSCESVDEVATFLKVSPQEIKKNIRNEYLEYNQSKKSIS